MKIYKLVSVSKDNQTGGAVKTYKPPTDQKLKKIGELAIINDMIIGEFEYQKISGMKKGKYTAYSYGDDLLVVHSSVSLDKKKLLNTKWKSTDAVVGVDGGRFGFFDSSVIQTNGNLRIPNIEPDAFREGIILDRTDFDNCECDEYDVGVVRYL